MTLFGLKNCDSCRKARQWLDSRAIDYVYHDVRADGLTKTQLKRFAEKVDWTTLVNRKSTTWRQLSPTLREAMTKATAIDTVVENPTLMKRPVLLTEDFVHVGFSADDYETLLGGR